VRPLDATDDPRAGVDHENPRIGLFSILEGDELIGGFGMKYRTFTEAGADNFPPDDQKPLSGFLCYGAVIRPEKRGRGCWRLAMLELLRRSGADGYFHITANPLSDEGLPWQHRKVGQTPTYIAYHTTLRHRSGSAAQRAMELQIENKTLRSEIEDCRRELSTSQSALSAIVSSRIWRATTPLRRLLAALQHR
jgi:hypothetical protein